MANMSHSHKKQTRQTKKTLNKLMAIMMVSTVLSPICTQKSNVCAHSTHSWFKFYTTAEHDASLKAAHNQLEMFKNSVEGLNDDRSYRMYDSKVKDLEKLLSNTGSYFFTKNKLDEYDNICEEATKGIQEVEKLRKKEAEAEKTRKADQSVLDELTTVVSDQLSQLENAFNSLKNESNQTKYATKVATLRNRVSKAASCDSMHDKLNSYKGIRESAERLLEEINRSAKQEITENAERLRNYQNELFNKKKASLISIITSNRDRIDKCLKNFEQADSYDNIVNDLKSEAENLISSLESFTLSDDARDTDLNAYENNLETLFSKINDDINSWLHEIDEFSKDIENVKAELMQTKINQAKEDLISRLQDLESDIDSKFSVDSLEEFEQKAINSILEMKNKLVKKIDSLHDFIDDSVVDLKTAAKAEKDFSLLMKETAKYEKEKNKIMNEVKKRREQEEFLASKLDFFKQLSMLRSGKLTLKQVVGGNEKIITKLDELVNLYKYRQETGKGNPSKGMILFGEPGTGKTTTVEAWAESHNYNLVILKRGVNDVDLVPEINAKFTEAKNLALNGKPTILLVDEIDAIGSKRIVGKTDKETVSFMGQLDNLKFSDNVIVIATTNSLSSVDPAVKRPGRLEIQVEMSLPSDDDIVKIAGICLDGFKFEGDQDAESFISTVLPYLRGGTPARTKRICESALASNMSSKRISAYRDVVLTVNDIAVAAQQYSD